MKMTQPQIALIICLILCLSLTVKAQVGIGNTNPEPSSMLDITSNTKGLLAPRMTTLEKVAIVSPANGLLVYDTDQAKFNYYNGLSWVIVEAGSNVIRDNYKLVKSVADLADELIAGGGTSYQLNSTYLYEINGTIVLDFPIELNEAYIRGQDTRGDILFNNTGTALFTGTKGGNIRDLLVVGNGQAAFNISGSPAQNLISNSVVYTNCSSLGTLSNLGLVFFNISQYINCTNGLTLTDINSFLMSNVFWTSTSSGTFLTFSGTFDDIQISSGRVSVDLGETGIDLSANPVVNNAGSINGVAFTGDGTRVNGYTTGSYVNSKFTNFWDVNSPGLNVETDNNATGDINLNAPVGSGFETTFTGTGVTSRTKLVGLSNSIHLFRFLSSVDNRIIYDGHQSRNFQISTTISFQGDNNNSIFIFYIAKGNSGDTTATVIEETRVYREVGENNDVGAAAIVGSVELNQGDFIEVWVERFSGSGDLLTVSLNLIAK